MWMSQYEYREKFGLSWQEYLEEPYSVYVWNSKIAKAVSSAARYIENGDTIKSRINN